MTATGKFPPVGDEPGWTFLSNHMHVMLCITSNPTLRLREVADMVGITERAVQRIVADLVNLRYLTRTRTGRRNQYVVHCDKPLRHPLEAHCTLGELIQLLRRETVAIHANSPTS